jgi:hypothetical protein
MKHMKLMPIIVLLLVSAGGAFAQSLGDYARAARKNKPEPNSATRHYDNDNLPTDQTISVVGPPPADAKADAKTDANDADANSAKSATAADRQKAADEMKDKLAKQKEKIDALNKELEGEQREVRLRTAAAVLGDPNALSRNGTQPDKDTAQYKSDLEAKQKAIDDARQQLDELQEQARKSGITEKENDKDSDKDKDKQ